MKTVSNSVARLSSLIPRQILFGNPEKINPQLSPDGKYLAYIAPDKDNILQVWLSTLESGELRKLTSDRKRGIQTYFWTYSQGKLIYLQDLDGNENFHLYLIDVDSNIVSNLTPFEGVTVQPIDLSYKFPDKITIALNLKQPHKFDVYHIDINNGDLKLELENPGHIISWTVDDQFQIRAALAATPDGGSELLFRKTANTQWEKLSQWGPNDQGNPIGFSQDGQTLYILSSHDSNTQRLIAINLVTKEETIVAEDSRYDVSYPLIHPIKKTVQAVFFYKEKLEWQLFDEEIAEDFAVISQICDGEFNLISRDLKDRTWLVAYTTDNGPVYYYKYERESKSSHFLFSDRPELEELSLASMQPISYEARDGLIIHGYLTLPINREEKNLPTVLLVHGGPWSRDIWGYNPIVQWLVNRGYAVLQVNYRGSTGYGKDFVNAGNRQWAAAMHEDLIDAVDWIVERNIADPRKIAIMGSSYGGYATLVGLTFTPDVFAAGVDIFGPSNLLTLMESLPPYWTPIQANMYHRIGNPQTEADFLKSRSPLFFVDRIKSPLLIGQGANDPRVKQSESDQIVEAMRQVGKPVKYIVYSDEGHSFTRPENRLHFCAMVEVFLAQHLGGRFEPLEKESAHSGIEH